MAEFQFLGILIPGNYFNIADFSFRSISLSYFYFTPLKFSQILHFDF